MRKKIGSMKRRLILPLLLALCLEMAVPAFAADFSDVPANYAFTDAIQYCTGKGILSGYSDGTFRPVESVTRAQFCVMLARAFYPRELEANAYLKSSGWFIPAAAALEDAGAAAYGHKNWFDSSVMNAVISRNDMARFICQVMTAKGYTVSQKDKAAAQAKITDYAGISEGFQEPIKTVFALGIITGYADGSFSGSRTMTRGQAAVVIYRMTQCLSGEPGVLDASVRQETKPAPTTLTNGKAVTEENVLAMLAELKKEYPEGMDFSMGYPLGDSSPVRSATYIYERAENPKTHTSNIEGCGGWTTLLSDGMFSQKGFEMRKTTLEEARPGDVMIQLDGNGRLVHVAMISRSPVTKDGRVSFAVTEAGTDQQGIYRVHWDVDYSWSANSRYTYDIWTRYPA